MDKIFVDHECDYCGVKMRPETSTHLGAIYTGGAVCAVCAHFFNPLSSLAAKNARRRMFAERQKAGKVPRQPEIDRWLEDEKQRYAEGKDDFITLNVECISEQRENPDPVAIRAELEEEYRIITEKHFEYLRTAAQDYLA